MAKHDYTGKIFYIYELINGMGTVEYVGCTIDPEYRFGQHTKAKPSAGQGKFYGRQDLTMHIVEVHEDRKEALLAEGRVKEENGLEWTERQHLVNAVRKMVEDGRLTERLRQNWEVNYEKMLRAVKRVGARHAESGHIQAIGSESMARQLQCPHCLKEGKGAIMGRWHFDRCKMNPDRA